MLHNAKKRTNQTTFQHKQYQRAKVTLLMCLSKGKSFRKADVEIGLLHSVCRQKPFNNYLIFAESFLNEKKFESERPEHILFAEIGSDS